MGGPAPGSAHTLDHSHPGVAILGRFYASTYPRLLGVGVTEADLVEVLSRVAVAFRDDPGLRIPLPFSDALAQPLSAYMNGTVQQERFAGILPDLVAADRPRVLDFGCGDASALRFLAEVSDARVLVGVDPIHGLPVTESGQRSKLVLVPTLDDAAGIEPEYDLVCAMYTLHHMTEAEASATVARLARLLAPGGRMFVVEDNPSFEGPPSSDSDRSYAALTEDQRRSVLELNDFWANVVVHDRPAQFQHYSFRASPEWMELFEREELEPIRTRSRGFNFERLHGVPTFESIWQSGSGNL